MKYAGAKHLTKSVLRAARKFKHKKIDKQASKTKRSRLLNNNHKQTSQTSEQVKDKWISLRQVDKFKTSGQVQEK